MTLGPMTLRADQAEAVEAMANEFTRAAILAAPLAWGKTVAGVELARAIGSRRTLVFGPLHTRGGWARTVERQGMGPFYEMHNNSKAGKDAQALYKSGAPGFYFAGREWGKLQDWKGQPGVDLFIQDETHTLANRKSAGVQALQYMYKGEMRQKLMRGYTLLMSGTPWGSSVEGQYSVSQVAWPELVDPSFSRWRDEWCETAYDHFAYDKKKTVGELVEGAWASQLPCYLAPPEPPMVELIEEDIWVDLLPAQRKLYERFEEEGFVWLQENPLSADIPIVKRTRLRQLLLAVASIRPAIKRVRNKETQEMEDVEYEQVFFEEDAASAKFDALLEFISDHSDESMLISTDSTKFAEIIVPRMKAAGLDAFEHTGNASEKSRETARTEFEEGRLKYLVVHPDTLGEGWDGGQKNCHIAVVLSESDKLVTNWQLKGRLRRPGQNHPVVIVRIKVNGTVDDDQAETLLNREVRIRAAQLAPELNSVVA